jgi:hypothetical protein
MEKVLHHVEMSRPFRTGRDNQAEFEVKIGFVAVENTVVGPAHANQI